MRFIIAFLLLAHIVKAQEPTQFQTDHQEMIQSLKQHGTRKLPDGLEKAVNLDTLKALRVKAAAEKVEALRNRHRAGLDNVDFLLKAQIELVLAKIDTTDDREKQLTYIQEGLNSAIQVWQMLDQLQAVGARGGDIASVTAARQNVFRFYVWWHKWKAGEDIGPTLLDSGQQPR